MGPAPASPGRAREHLLAHEPSVDALELIVLAGSRAHKARAAEIILAQKPAQAVLLRAVISSFLEGPTAVRAWRVFDTLAPEIDLLSRARTADHLLRGGLDTLDDLTHVIENSPDPDHHNEAARRILRPRKPKPGSSHLAAIVLRATDPALIERAWTAFAALSFTAKKRDQWNLVYLRNILCSARAPELRARALELAKSAPFDADDRAYIAKHAKVPAVRKAFKKA